MKILSNLKYLRSRYYSALELLNEYRYPSPFHLVSKQFFKAHKKFGSNLENETKLFKNIVKTFQEIRFDISNKEIPSKKIIFICGMPRSGTTLTEQIIASHTDVYGAGELVYLQQVLKKNFFPFIYLLNLKNFLK